LVAVLLSIFFGKVPLSNFVCGTALKSYIGGTDFSERQNHVFDKKMVYLAQFNILLGYYFKILGEALIQDFWSWYYFKFFLAKYRFQIFIRGTALKS
jgi:hypothetical protein